MKLTKKVLCVLLSTVFLFSAVSVGFVSFADDEQLDSSYNTLAYMFFKTHTESSGGYNKTVIDTDENGVKKASIIRDMNQYTVENKQGDYVYNDSSSNTVRSFAYNHKVTALDDGSNSIRNAAIQFYAIADNIMSTTYGIGNYTIPMIADTVKNKLRAMKDSDGNFLYFDGYSYFVDALGDLVGVSDHKTYEIDTDGTITWYNAQKPDGTWYYDPSIKTEDKSIADKIKDGNYGEDLRNKFKSGDIEEKTLFDYLNVETVIDYFCGNCTTVNSGNWFHTYEFYCYTDVNTVLLTEDIKPMPITIRYLDVTWSMDRSFDDSGTRPQYYNKGYTIDKDRNSVDRSRVELYSLKNSLQQYFSKYYGPDNNVEGASKLQVETNSDLMTNAYKDIMSHYDVFNSISNEAKIKIYGDDAYSYINLATQLKPIAMEQKYLPSRTVGDYIDKSTGKAVTYDVTTEKVTTIVDTIDSLMANKKLGASLHSFLPPENDLLGGKDYSTPKEMVINILDNMLYQDSIINLLLKTIYPMLTNVIDENITDAFIKNALGSAGSTIAGWVVDDSNGWQALVYKLLIQEDIGVTPSGIARCMAKTGFDKKYPTVFEQLKAAKGGVVEYDGYYAVGKENDEYMGQRWKDVNFDTLYWGVNGDRGKFQEALSGVLLGAAPLLAAVLGNQQFKIEVTTIMWSRVWAIIKGAQGWNDIFLPLFETLGIDASNGLVNQADFEQSARIMINAYQQSNVTSFINLITGPLFNWIENDVLDNPVETVLSLLPNLSYYLTSGTLLSTIKTFQLVIRIEWTDAVKVDVYTLKIGDLLGDKINFLNSLDNVLKLISLGAKTGSPIIGYTASGKTAAGGPYSGTAIYKTTDEAVMAAKQYGCVSNSIETVGVTEAYKNVNGDLSLYPDSEYTELVTGLNSDGSINTDIAVLENIAYSNAAGVVLDADELTTTELVNEYKNKVKIYYSYYTYTDPETGKETTSKDKPGEDIAFTLTRTTIKPADTINYKTVFSAVMEKKEVSLPVLMDYKLQATGTERQVSSLRNTAITNDYGTWNANTRKYIEMTVDGKESYGLVLLYIFRYLFSALNYRAFDMQTNEFATDLTLLDAFGLGDTLTKNLFYGLKLEDIINNVTLNPDEAIAALYELFYTNEFGSVLSVQENSDGTKSIVRGKNYTYYLDPVDYKTDELMEYAEKYDDYTFGSGVLYTQYWTKENAQYVTNNLDGLVENVLAMLKIEDLDSLTGFLEDKLAGFLFNNEMLSKIANLVYGMIGGLNLESLLNNALDIDYSKQALANALDYEFKYTDENGNPKTVFAAGWIRSDAKKTLEDGTVKGNTYDKNTFYQTGINEETGEDMLVAIDWGYNNPEITSRYSGREIFLRAISALASPLSLLIRFLALDENLSIFDLVTIPGYAGYYYAWIPLMEALTANSDLITYQDYYTRVYAGESVVSQNCDCIYYFLKPLFTFVEELLADPVSVLLNMIPNLMFFITIGGLNETINNLLHFVYVLLDILQPVYDAYPLINKFLSNLEVGGMVLNLSVPLDFDANQLINSLIESLVGTALSFDIENKNIVLGKHMETKEQPKLDADGNQILDADGNVIMEQVEVEVTDYAVGKLNISLPYIDLSTLCVGTLTKVTSKNNEQIIFLNSAGGADFLTLALRLVMQTLFYQANAINLSNFLITFCMLDKEDSTLLTNIFTFLNEAANNNEIPDKIMGFLFQLISFLVPVADNLGDRFRKVDFSITDLFKAFGTDNFMKYLQALLNAGGNSTEKLSLIARIMRMIVALFQKIALFFKSLFGGGKTVTA